MLRVLHLPAQTPYARKLTCTDFSPVNGREFDGKIIPFDCTFDWVLRQAELNFFDVVHVHSFEFVSDETLIQFNQRCVASGKGVVVTLHDVQPMFDIPLNVFWNRVRLFTAAGARIYTLTEGAAVCVKKELCPEIVSVEVIPHGYVLPLTDKHWDFFKAPQSENRRFGMYGALRPNRDFVMPVINFTFGISSRRAEFKILSRALSAAHLQRYPEVSTVLACVNRDPRIKLKINAFPSDDEIVSFVKGCDIIVMPYRWGAHSGQLELAMDMGKTVIISDVGFYEEQVALYASLGVEMQIVVKWKGVDDYQHGSVLLSAMEEAIHRRPNCTYFLKMRRKLYEYRRDEHVAILKRVGAIYNSALVSVSIPSC